jgi:hypothetical protein
MSFQFQWLSRCGSQCVGLNNPSVVDIAPRCVVTTWYLALLPVLTVLLLLLLSCWSAGSC